MAKKVQIIHSMFPNLIPSKLDLVVEYEITRVFNYRATPSDNGRNIASITCLNSWPTESGIARCKGKNSVYHYQWMDASNTIRCGKCGCRWIYNTSLYNQAHKLNYTLDGSLDDNYPLITDIDKE